MNQFVRSMNQLAREAEREQKRQIREQHAAVRRAEKAIKDAQRAQLQNEREARKLYVAAQEAQCDVMNADLGVRLTDIDSILEQTLRVDDYIDFEKLRRVWREEVFQPGDIGVPKSQPNWRSYEPAKPTGLSKLFSGKRYKEALELARQEYDRDCEECLKNEQTRIQTLEQMKLLFERRQEESRQATELHNQEVDSFKADFENGNPEAIVEYFSLVLSNSVYPADFPQHFKLAYVPESKQIVCEYDLPSTDVIPRERSFRYVKTRDEFTSVARPAKESKGLYSSLIAQLVIRTLHELFESDRTHLLDVVSLNGMVDGINSATGQPVRSCVISLRVTRDELAGLDLSRVDPAACLKQLKASISRAPDELVAVRPVIEFDMVDQRFVDETDVLSDLDHRPNLLDLSPTEFESLIQNLFGKMGLETRQTRASRDGGIDCVAFDSRPIFGGKIVIQAKRYKNTVDVSAVRDLFGSMQNEGATKGILVTTSSYGPTAYDFAKDKPLELIDGRNLLYLLQEHAGIAAQITLDAH